MKTYFLTTVFILLCVAISAQHPGDLYTGFADEGIFLADWEDTTLIVTDIAVIPDGNILITGTFNAGDAELEDFLITKLDPSGNVTSFGNFK